MRIINYQNTKLFNFFILFSSAFHQMLPSKTINMQFVRRVEKLLAPPFPTKCFTYSPEHIPNPKILSEHIYRSRGILICFPFQVYSLFIYMLYKLGECLLQCLWKTLNQKCANMYSIYTRPIVEEEENRQNMEQMMKMLKTEKSLLNMTFENETSEFFKLCPKTNTSFREYIIAKEYCIKACPPACHSVTYNEDRVYTTDIKSTVDSFAVISWASTPEVSLRHQAKWDQADFLGKLTKHIFVN